MHTPTIYGCKDTNVKPAVINEVTKISLSTQWGQFSGECPASDINIVYVCKENKEKSFDL